MIAPDYLKRIAAWSRELNEREIEIARAGIIEKSYRANEYIFMRGDPSNIGPASSPASPGWASFPRRQGRELCRPHRGRLVRRGQRAQERGLAATTWWRCATQGSP